MTEPAPERPKPLYGEYSDEVLAAAQAGEDAAAPVTTTAAGTPAAVPAVTPASAGASATPLPGVPHNLGVRGGAAGSGSNQAAAQPAAGPQSQPAQQPQHGEPYRAPHPQGAAQGPEHSPTQQQPAQFVQPTQPLTTGYTGQATPAAVKPQSRVDRVITIFLLALGAFGVLNSGVAMLRLPAQMQMAATAFGVDDFVVPQSVGTIGTVGAIILLALYAVALLLSIRMLRAKKITFWVPLAAGAIAFLVVFAIMMITFAQSPELLQQMAQPDAMQKFMDYYASMGQSRS